MSVFPFKLACLNRELTRAFRARSVTYNKAPYPLDSLLSMTMTERKKKELGNLELKHLYKSKRNTHTHTHIYIYIYISKYTFLGLDRGVFFLSNLHVLIILFDLYSIVINIYPIERSISNPLSNKSIVVGLLGHCPSLFWAVDQVVSLQ